MVPNCFLNASAPPSGRITFLIAGANASRAVARTLSMGIHTGSLPAGMLMTPSDQHVGWSRPSTHVGGDCHSDEAQPDSRCSGGPRNYSCALALTASSAGRLYPANTTPGAKTGLVCCGLFTGTWLYQRLYRVAFRIGRLTSGISRVTSSFASRVKCLVRAICP